MKKFLGIFLKIFVSLAGLSFIAFFFRGRWDAVFSILREIHLEYFLLAFFVLAFSFFLISIRLQLILRVQNAKIHIWELFYWTGVGQFFSLFLPSSVGGDVLKGYFLSKQTESKITAFSSVFLDRLAGAFAVATIALVAVYCYGKQMGPEGVLSSIWVVAIIICLLSLFFVSRRFAAFVGKLNRFPIKGKLAERLEQIHDALDLFRCNKIMLMQVIGISAVSQTVFIIIHMILGIALDLQIPIAAYFVAVPIITAASMAPSINGLGVREAGFVYLFGKFTTDERALALSIIFGILIYLIGFLFGLVFMVRDGFVRGLLRQAKEVESEVDDALEDEFRRGHNEGA